MAKKKCLMQKQKKGCPDAQERRRVMLLKFLQSMAAFLWPFVPELQFAVVALMGLMRENYRNTDTRVYVFLFVPIVVAMLNGNFAIAGFFLLLPWMAKPAYSFFVELNSKLVFLCCGLVCTLLFAVVQNILSNHAFLPRWNTNAAVFSLNQQGVGTAFQDSGKNAFLYHNSTRQGPGEVGFSVEIRSDSLKSLALWLDNGKPQSLLVKPSVCAISNTWKTCSVFKSSVVKEKMGLMVGGYGSWVTKGTSFQMRNVRLLGTMQHDNWLDLLSELGRTQGTSFSPNAFAAVLALIVFAICAMPAQTGWFYISVVLAVVGVVLSGSRNAMLALVALAGFYFFAAVFRDRRLLARNVLLAGFALLLGVLMVNRLRVFQVNDDFLNSRLVLFHISFDAWRQSPFWGFQDARAAMINVHQHSHSFRNSIPLQEVTHSHNMWLWCALNLGLLGTIPVFALFLFLGYNVVKNKERLMLHLFFGLIALNQFDNFIFHGAFQLALAAVCFSVYDKIRFQQVVRVKK